MDLVHTLVYSLVSVSRLGTELPEILASWDGGEAVNLSAISDVPFRGNPRPPPKLTLTLTLPLAPALVSCFRPPSPNHHPAWPSNPLVAYIHP
jgi:hypothetical protein